MRTLSRILQLFVGITLLVHLDMLEAEDKALTEIASGIYLRPGVQEEFSSHNKGHIANIGFIVGSRRVAVIDTGSSYQEGLALRQMIREKTDLPIAYVILTHMHPDHSLGVDAFDQDNPIVIGHEQLADAMARRQTVYLERMKQILGSTAEDTQMVFPSDKVAVDQETIVDLGGRSLTLQAYPTAHTNNDLSVFDPATGTLWLSDLLFVERIPVLDGSLLGWLKVIDRLSGQDCIFMPVETEVLNKPQLDSSERCVPVERVVPGHGPVVSEWKNALAEQRRYLELIATGIRESIKRGKTLTEAVKEVGWSEKGKWQLFKEYHGRNVTAGFVELEWE